MTVKMHLRSLIALAAIVSLASGCVRTDVPPPQILAATEKLTRTATHSLALKLTYPAPASSHGHQFLLLALPFGVVHAEDPPEAVRVVLTEELARRGIRIDQASPHRLEITIDDLSLSAFDLLITRRLVSDVTLTGVLSPATRSPRREQARGSATSYSRFGFAPELQRTFRTALQVAAATLCDALRLPSPGAREVK